MFHILVFSFFYCNSQKKNLQFFVTQKIIPILLYSSSTYNSKRLYLKSAKSYWPLEKEMATHSSTLAWKIPWTEKPGRQQSMGSLDFLTLLTFQKEKKLE